MLKNKHRAVILSEEFIPVKSQCVWDKRTELMKQFDITNRFRFKNNPGTGNSPCPRTVFAPSKLEIRIEAAGSLREGQEGAFHTGGHFIELDAEGESSAAVHHRFSFAHDLTRDAHRQRLA